MVLSEFAPENFPLVVAHRGASADHPENTLAAFEAAIEVGADVVELDVRLSADGAPVVLHDPDVSAVSNGRGAVHRLALSELKRLRVQGQEIPTLQEALETLSGRAGIDIEIKNLPGEEAFDSPREAIVEAVVRALDETAFSGRVLVSSFNWLSIERARALAPGVMTGFLTIAAIDPRAALVYARSRDHGFVLPHVDALLAAGPGFVEEAHRDGLRVGTWTVDEEDRLVSLFEWGVDAIASNVPALAVRAREASRA
jgi:glycerophosphoryl diester phosphodiesterase